MHIIFGIILGLPAIDSLILIKMPRFYALVGIPLMNKLYDTKIPINYELYIYAIDSKIKSFKIWVDKDTLLFRTKFNLLYRNFNLFL